MWNIKNHRKELFACLPFSNQQLSPLDSVKDTLFKKRLVETHVLIIMNEIHTFFQINKYIKQGGKKTVTFWTRLSENLNEFKNRNHSDSRAKLI